MRKGRTGDAATSFVQCQKCKKTLFAAEFESNLRVCNYCGHHHRLTYRQRIDSTFDEGTFKEEDTDLRSGDPLQFPEYKEKHAQSVQKTGIQDSVVSGTALLNSKLVATAIADFHFMGGSMGSVAGEKITRTLERAVDLKCPAIVFCASGGARMQEGLLSLMQMAKTTAAVQKCNDNGTPFIAVFTDPTMAGVLASYASVADVIIAEPKALVGFAGARVSKQAQVVKAPDDFQTAEFAERAGMIDAIVERRDLKATLTTLVQLFGAHLKQEAKIG